MPKPATNAQAIAQGDDLLITAQEPAGPYSRVVVWTAKVGGYRLGTMQKSAAGLQLLAKGFADKTIDFDIRAVAADNTTAHTPCCYAPTAPAIAPTALIVAKQLTAPAMIHVQTPGPVQALNIEKRYEWQLPGFYRRLPGFNAAAFIDIPDVSSINHVVDGVSLGGESFVVGPDIRAKYCIHPNGNDAAAGTVAAPWKTPGKAALALAGRKDVAVYFARAGKWELGTTLIFKNLVNAVIGAYGSGDVPVLRMLTRNTCIRLETRRPKAWA